jgi:hypothetical protein
MEIWLAKALNVIENNIKQQKKLMESYRDIFKSNLIKLNFIIENDATDLLAISDRLQTLNTLLQAMQLTQTQISAQEALFDAISCLKN